MKLLDPFAGLRLASGHPIFHIALFVGSFMINVFGEDNFRAPKTVQDAFNVLRWGHFILFVLCIIEFLVNRPSSVKKIESG